MITSYFIKDQFIMYRLKTRKASLKRYKKQAQEINFDVMRIKAIFYVKNRIRKKEDYPKLYVLIQVIFMLLKSCYPIRNKNNPK